MANGGKMATRRSAHQGSCPRGFEPDGKDGIVTAERGQESLDAVERELEELAPLGALALGHEGVEEVAPPHLGGTVTGDLLEVAVEAQDAAPEVEHQDGQSANQQGDGQQPRHARQRLVGEAQLMEVPTHEGRSASHRVG